MTTHPPRRSPDLRRTAGEVTDELLRRRPGYVPAWSARPGDPGRAVLTAEATMAASLWARVDKAPDKHKMAFLSSLGIDALPPAAARAPVRFDPLPAPPGLSDRVTVGAVVPAGSAVGAPAPDGGHVAFRTEHDLGISPSVLAEVRSVVPGSDAVADHTTEALGGRPFAPFTGARPVRRALYLGHDRLFALKDEATITVEVELAQDSRVPLQLTWSVWDGTVWRVFPADQVTDLTDTRAAPDEPARSLGRSGTVTMSSHGIESAQTEVDGIPSYWLRAQLDSVLGPADPLALPQIDQIRVAVTLGSASTPVTLPLTTLLVDGSPVDPTLPFLPLGPAPDRTSVLYVDATDVVAAGTATADLVVATSPSTGRAPTADPDLLVEYWNGRGWVDLVPGGTFTPEADNVRNVLPVTMPSDWLPSQVQEETGTWARLRLAPGSSYAGTREIQIGSDTVEVPESAPVLFSDLRVEVRGRSPATAADHVITFDGSLHRERTEAARWRGTPFTPFTPLEDRTPALYLGFDGPLPAAELGLLFEIEPPADGKGASPAEHELLWERYDGRGWTTLPVEDGTDHLTDTGLVRPTWPGNRPLRRVGPARAVGTTVTTLTPADAARFEAGELVHVRDENGGELVTVASVAGRTITLSRPLRDEHPRATVEDPEPPLFGTPRTWLRARLTPGSPLPDVTVNRVVPNVAWTTQSRPVNGEVLGSGTGRPNQRLFSTYAPLLPGLVVEVRELEGPRSRTDLPILERELAGSPHTLVVERADDGSPTAVWVRWTVRPNLTSSGPTDRHLTVDLATGVHRFGDDRHGRALPTGASNVRLTGTSGGGPQGNVAAGAIATPLSAMLVGALSNPVAASGGAAAETAERAILRAPHVVRHRFQAVTESDYGALALEASPEVLLATVVAHPDDLGGTLAVHVLPESHATPPVPSAQLLEKVRRHLVRRCPPGALVGLTVTGPVFVPVGLEVTVALRPTPGDVRPGNPLDRVADAVRSSLHPVTGGHGFGATVHPARLAGLLENHPDVDHVESFTVLVGGRVAGTSHQLGRAELPVPGAVTLTLTRPEVH